jgi:hypothetical protein
VEETRKCFFDKWADLFCVTNKYAVFAWFNEIVWLEVVFTMGLGVMEIWGLVFTIRMKFRRIRAVRSNRTVV